jgi:hypothetical protein
MFYMGLIIQSPFDSTCWGLLSLWAV